MRRADPAEPHVSLDTVVLLGSTARCHPGRQWWSAAGAITASTAWSAALGHGARLLRPVVARPRAWQVPDTGIVAVMLALTTSLAPGAA